MSAALDRHRARVREYLEGDALTDAAKKAQAEMAARSTRRPVREYYDPKRPDITTQAQAQWAAEAGKSSVPLWQAALDEQNKPKPYYGPDVNPSTGTYASSAPPTMTFTSAEIAEYERQQAAARAARVPYASAPVPTYAPSGPYYGPDVNPQAGTYAPRPSYAPAPPTQVAPAGLAPSSILVGVGVLAVAGAVFMMMRKK